MKENDKTELIFGVIIILLLVAFWILQYNAPEVPTIDGVMMRNEAQMYNGYGG